MYCKYCGNKLDKACKYCSKCGKSVETEVVNVEAGKDRALASMIIGIISLFVGVLFIPLPIVGLVLASSYKNKCAEKTAGIILNTISLVFAIVTLIASIVIGVIFGVRVAEKALSEIDFGQIISSEIYDDTMWEKYKFNRIDEIVDFTTDIEGNWKNYINENSYYVFNDNEFYYYSDVNDMENNYWEGTYTYTNSREIIKVPFEKETTLENLMNKFNINIDEDYNLINLNVTKIVKNGNEQIEFEEGREDVRFLIIKEHEDGIEGIIINPDDESSKYFYKVK